MKIIQSDEHLETYIGSIENEKELAIDTEFKRVNTYNPILCLVQIATRNEAVCIDVLSVKNLKPLFEKLYRNDTLWIVHSARQDIEAFFCLSNQLPRQLFDTQIAASLINFPSQISYQSLTEQLQGVYLEKEFTRLDWTTRPLPNGAIKYALDDVIYLLKNYHYLVKELSLSNKTSWNLEESEKLLDSSLYRTPINQSWKKVKGLARLPIKAQLSATKLSAYREHIAQTENKPRKWIMSDEKLNNYALGKEPMDSKTLDKFDRFIKEHPDTNNINLLAKDNNPPTQKEKEQKKKIQKLIEMKSNQYNLQPEVIANTKSIMKYIRGDNSVCFCSGWRHSLLKEELKC
jgi:ribonuclease D